MTKRIYSYAAGLLTALVTVITLSVQPATAVSGARDCDNGVNSIIDCGALTVSELRQDFATNNAGKQPDVQTVFAHYGITLDDIDGKTSTVKMGRITKTGDVYVGSELVATGARSVGRAALEGSAPVTISGKTYYFERTSGSAFQTDEIPAFVFFRDNQFYRAVITSCANPATATPVPPKKTPVATCKAITANKISRTEFSFDGSATVADGATIKSYVFTVKNSAGSIVSTKTVATTDLSANSGTFNLTKADTYTISLTVNTSLGARTDTNCVTTIEVKPEPVTPVVSVDKQVCDVTTNTVITIKESEATSPNYKPVGDEACQPKAVAPVIVAKTGPEQVVGGMIGLGSLTAAGYYFQASRRRVIASLIKQ